VRNTDRVRGARTDFAVRAESSIRFVAGIGVSFSASSGSAQRRDALAGVSALSNKAGRFRVTHVNGISAELDSDTGHGDFDPELEKKFLAWLKGIVEQQARDRARYGPRLRKLLMKFEGLGGSEAMIKEITEREPRSAS